ncbi:ABC transporter permease [Mesorhizobium hawassense]|uniref:ABC transporter permease n=1 Tax=Mesorhizobium hawassense TaxID=1209954 RepID=A0A330HP35_9HYPH|nr:ABC transporter permease [Mesorhizobium hawassense]RAZ90466.1 ABC transporter permease [Mesorhizobium hawassense]
MAGWLSNVFRLGLKELASLAADTVLAAFIVYSFSFAVFSQATGIKTEVANAPVAIVDSDHSLLSTRIRDGFLQPYFRRPALIDRSGIDDVMDRGVYTFVLDIPPRFEADVLLGRHPSVQLNVDATAMTQAGVGGAYVESIVQQETRDYLHTHGVDDQIPLTAVARTFFNPNLEGLRFEAIMAVLQNITMLSMLLVGAAVIREREHGTIEHLLVMPVRPSEIAAAKILANGLAILVATGLSLLIVVEHLLHVPIQGSIFLFLGGTAVYLFAIASLGILLATIANTMPQFALLAMPVFLVLNMLSGGVTPLESMPEPLQLAVQASPAMHFVKFAQSVLYRGAGADVVWPQIAVLSLLGTVFLAIALSRFRAMLARVQ